MYKKINENPKIADTIVFDILTPDINGNLVDPYKVLDIKIYFIIRDFNGNNYGQLDSEIQDLTSISYFDEAIVTTTVGNSEFPAWLSSDTENAFIEHALDEDGNPIPGHFLFNWEAVGIREGDYIIVWSWNPLPASDTLTNHVQFYVSSNTQLTTSIPTHFTNPKKYSDLLSRYTPEILKTKLSANDLTPEVIGEFNEAVAKGFTLVEDLANQMIDLLDANATNELFLVYLSNLFNLKLRSNDPTLWRRQIKNAIPLYKKKGTLNGLQEALSQAGITLIKYHYLWQVVSKYTWQEAFTKTTENGFVLSKQVILPIDVNNFQLFYRSKDELEWSELTSDYVNIEEVDGLFIVTWVGGNLSFNPIVLNEGDELRIVYQTSEIPSINEQNVESYIRNLPLSDQRDMREQDYPPINWNVRLIEEDDPVFNTIVPNQHPYYDKLIYGKVRTEFPYSENIYNMEEYNGSSRDSYEPCDIDKDFVDSCSGGRSSKFSVDIDIENITDHRIIEAIEIIEEFVPFHSILHSLNLAASINEFIVPPLENIEMLIKFQLLDTAIVGDGQISFNRIMDNRALIMRNMLADESLVADDETAIAYNSEIVLLSPNNKMDELSLDKSSAYTLLEVMSPHINSGEYTVENANDNYVKVVESPPEPLDQSPFTFRLSNERIKNNFGEIVQDNIFKFYDTNFDFGKLEIKTQWDVDHNDYTGVLWKVNLPDYSNSYNVLNILPDGGLLLENTADSLPSNNASNLTYSLLNQNNDSIQSGINGSLKVVHRGLVTMDGTNNIKGNNTLVENIRNYVHLGDYAKVNSDQYKVIGFKDNGFYIENYNNGNFSGLIVVYQRLLDNKIGNFYYNGWNIQTLVNQETNLEIVNGDNSITDPEDQTEASNFKEDFLIMINDNLYVIVGIDGVNIKLEGLPKDWTTLNNGGTPVEYSIIHYQKNGAMIQEILETATDTGEVVRYVPGAIFNKLDRNGGEMITIDAQNDEVSAAMVMNAMNQQDVNNLMDVTTQQESISFTVRWKNDKE